MWVVVGGWGGCEVGVAVEGLLVRQTQPAQAVGVGWAVEVVVSWLWVLWGGVTML